MCAATTIINSVCMKNKVTPVYTYDDHHGEICRYRFHAELTIEKLKVRGCGFSKKEARNNACEKALHILTGIGESAGSSEQMSIPDVLKLASPAMSSSLPVNRLSSSADRYRSCMEMSESLPMRFMEECHGPIEPSAYICPEGSWGKTSCSSSAAVAKKSVMTEADISCNKQSSVSALSVLYDLGRKHNFVADFTECAASGPHHRRVFTIKCRVKGYITSGIGSSKKSAKQNAATSMLACLRRMYGKEIDKWHHGDVEVMGKKEEEKEISMMGCHSLWSQRSPESASTVSMTEHSHDFIPLSEDFEEPVREERNPCKEFRRGQRYFHVESTPNSPPMPKLSRISSPKEESTVMVHWCPDLSNDTIKGRLEAPNFHQQEEDEISEDDVGFDVVFNLFDHELDMNDKAVDSLNLLKQTRQKKREFEENKETLQEFAICEQTGCATKSFISEIKHTHGEVMQTSDEVKQTSGDAKQTSHEVKQISDKVKQTSGDAIQTSGEVKQTSHEVKRASGDTMQTSGEVKQTSHEVKQISDKVKQASGDAKQTSHEVKQISDKVKQTSTYVKKTSHEITCRISEVDVNFKSFAAACKSTHEEAEKFLTKEMTEAIRENSSLSDQGESKTNFFTCRPCYDCKKLDSEQQEQNEKESRGTEVGNYFPDMLPSGKINDDHTPKSNNSSIQDEEIYQQIPGNLIKALKQTAELLKMPIEVLLKEIKSSFGDNRLTGGKDQSTFTKDGTPDEQEDGVEAELKKETHHSSHERKWSRSRKKSQGQRETVITSETKGEDGNTLRHYSQRKRKQHIKEDFYDHFQSSYILGLIRGTKQDRKGNKSKSACDKVASMAGENKTTACKTKVAAPSLNVDSAPVHNAGDSNAGVPNTSVIDSTALQNVQRVTADNASVSDLTLNTASANSASVSSPHIQEVNGWQEASTAHDAKQGKEVVSYQDGESVVSVKSKTVRRKKGNSWTRKRKTRLPTDANQENKDTAVSKTIKRDGKSSAQSVMSKREEEKFDLVDAVDNDSLSADKFYGILDDVLQNSEEIDDSTKDFPNNIVTDPEEEALNCFNTDWVTMEEGALMDSRMADCTGTMESGDFNGSGTTDFMTPSFTDEVPRFCGSETSCYPGYQYHDLHVPYNELCSPHKCLFSSNAEFQADRGMYMICPPIQHVSNIETGFPSESMMGLLTSSTELLYGDYAGFTQRMF